MITKIAICDRDKEYMYNFKEKIESMLGVVVKPFENLSELKENRKFEDYKLILVEDKLQSKIKEKIIITDNPNKPNALYKYKSIKEMAKDISSELLKVNKNEKDENTFFTILEKNIDDEKLKSINSVVIYDVSMLDNKCISKVIKILANNEKSFFWNNEMFSNEMYDDGMDFISALYLKELFDKENINGKLHRYDQNIDSFCPTRNTLEMLNIKPDDEYNLFKKIINHDYKNVFIYKSGRIDVNDIKYIDNAKSIVLLYDPKDEIKKNKVKKFFDQYLKLKDKNIQVVPFRINENDKKDYLRINSLKESLC